MPQLDPAGFVPQLFWLAVTFLVLFLLMKGIAVPQVGRAIEARRRQLDGDLGRAAELKAQAETVLAAYEKALMEARAEAQATLRETSARLAAEAAERQRQLAATLAAQIEAAEQRIAAGKDQALAEIRGIAVDVGQAVVERLTGSRPGGGPDGGGGRQHARRAPVGLMHLFGDPEFWVAVAAAIFVAIAWKPARKALIGSLDARAAAIRAELDEAHKLRAEAEQLLAEYQRKQHEAAAEARAIIAHARDEAERIAAQSARDLDQALTRRQLLAEERIAQAEAKAVGEIRSAAVDVAIAAAREVITAETDDERGGGLLDAAIATLPQRLR